MNSSAHKSKSRSKRGGSRPNSGPEAYEPTEADRATVTIMHACGKTQKQIGPCIGPGMSDVTLRKHFRRELDIAKDKLDGICMTGIAKAMQEGQPWALCFYAKTRMGWRETVKAVFSGEDGGPIETNVTSAKELLAARIAGIAGRIGKESGNSGFVGSGSAGDLMGLAGLRSQA